MATADQVKEAKDAIKRILELKEEKLVSRPEKWGELNFEEVKVEIESIFEMARLLQNLQMEAIPDSVFRDLKGGINRAANGLKSIDAFSTASSNNVHETRARLVQQVRDAWNEIGASAVPWISFLTSKSKDFGNTIKKVEETNVRAEKTIETFQNNIQKQQQDLQKAVAAAKVAAGSLGAEVFSDAFLQEAKTLKKEAARWLVATALLAITTLGVAWWMWTNPVSGLDSGGIIQNVTTKFIILITMFTATLWCGRIYKALMHQSAVNRHRALGLQTFRAFTESAVGASTKDAVLMETTRSIFQNHATGYIESPEHEPDTKIVEIIKSVVSKEK